MSDTEATIDITSDPIIELGEVDTDQKRNSFFTCDPRMVATDPETMGRDADRPGYAEEIIETALSIYQLGQLQPVMVRQDGDQLLVVAGNRRTQAIQMLQRGFDHGGVWYQKPNIRLQYTKLDTRGLNASELRRRNVAENKQRVQTTIIDDAQNMLAFIQQDEWTVEEVAAEFKVSTSTVNNAIKLLELDRAQQQLVATGQLSQEAALRLLELPRKDRKAAVAAATVTTAAGATKVNTAQINNQVRANRAQVAAAQPAAPSSAVANGKVATKAPASSKITRSWAEVRNELRNQEPAAPQLKGLLAAILGFADGTVDTDAFAKAVTKLDNLISDADKLLGNVTAK